MKKKERSLGLILVLCLISLSLPVQAVAGECTSFTDARYYATTLRPNNMIPCGIAGYVNFRNNSSKIPYYNATITDTYMNIQANGSIYIDIYKTYWDDNESRISYELIRSENLIAQPGVGLNTTILLPYLNGYILFGNDTYYTYTPWILLLMTNLANSTIYLEVTTIICWDVYFVEDDVVSITNETEIIETTETIETTEPADNETEIPTSTTSNVVVGGDTPSIWAIIMSVIIAGEVGAIVILRKLIMHKRSGMK